jgi:hypothetical protein
MDRAEWPDRADSASPPLDAHDPTSRDAETGALTVADGADTANPALGDADRDDSGAATIDLLSVPDQPAPEATNRAVTVEPPSAQAEPARDATSRAARPRPIVRVVGAPPEPDAVREPAEVALRALPVAGIGRRRLGWIIGAVISVWIVAVFARQVGEASAAAARADHVRSENAAIATQVAALQHERDVVQERSFVEFQARKWGLGNAQDQRFSLAQNAPPLPSNAPGSASVRLAPDPTPQTPLEAWLSLLFGPSR